ncbi:MAG: glycosyltransferase [Gammaproteobacteria bacterium]|jgi:undecaprenyl-phosphate 4-deoxy-4-formamido-L-arabinose transferase|nr:glycosyltransferase [Gammaproteobacteria bacterium]
MNSVSVVIPVYNAELSLQKLLGQLAPAMEAVTTSFEVILVDDCSRDGSWGIIKSLQAADSRVRGIRLSRNYGQHNALLCGIRAAQYEAVVTMDDDLQNPVSEVPGLLAKLNEGFDVVYGTPARQQHGLLRDLASSLTKLALQNVMGAETARKVSAFRAFRTRLRDGFENYNSPYVSIDVLLTWSTSNFTSITVKHDPRELGESNYTVGKLVSHAVNMLTGFTTFPLQLASMIGFVFMLFGLGVLVWVVAKWLIYGSSVPGFAFLASIISIFSGVQLFTLGIFGEYLARIHFRTMDRPPYVVGEE